MATNTTDPYKSICLILGQKVSLMTQYLSLTLTMKEAFLLNKEIHLEKLLVQRQECIAGIQKIDLSLQKVLGAGAKELSRFSDSLKEKIDLYLQRIKGLLDRISPIDTEVMAMVEGESRAIKAELLNLRKSRQAAKGYDPLNRNIPRFIDARR